MELSTALIIRAEDQINNTKLQQRIPEQEVIIKIKFGRPNKYISTMMMTKMSSIRSTTPIFDLGATLRFAMGEHDLPARVPTVYRFFSATVQPDKPIVHLKWW